MSMAKEKIWVEVFVMPSGVEPEDKLLIRGHQFIKSELVEKLNNATDEHRSV